MFNNLSLRLKLIIGFFSIAAIAVIVGGLAFISMNSVKGTTNILAKENVPEVSLSTDIERNMLNAAYEIRAYALSEDLKSLEKGKDFLQKARKSIEDTKKHGEISSRLVELRERAQQAEEKLTRYEELLAKTVEYTNSMDAEKKAATEAAQNYMKLATSFYETQKEGFLGEIRAGMDSDILEIRLKRIGFVKEIADMGNLIVSQVWQAQARRDVKLISTVLKDFDIVKVKLDSLKKITDYEGDLKKIDDVRGSADLYKTAMDKYFKTWNDREAISIERQQALEDLIVIAKVTSSKGLEDVVLGSKSAASSLTASAAFLFGGVILCALFSVFIGWLITGMITKPINFIVKRLDEGAEQTSSASSQVASASQQLSQGATEQAASLEETSSSLDEMSSMTRANADNASKASQLSQEARSNAEEGNNAMQEMQKAMLEINESSDKISKIIKTIEEIAFQTNLLALNAAVEAARAGEHGKGFAVVAEEVRNLARRSAESAKDTATLIEDSINKVKNGNEIAKKAGTSLQSITTGAKKVADIVSEIAAASKEQAEGINQITNAVSQMDQVTQQNASVAEESASASEELTAQAQTLKGLVIELEQLVKGGKALEKSTIAKTIIEKRKDVKPLNVTKVVAKFEHKAKSNKPGTGASQKSHTVLNPEDVIPLEDEKTLKQF